MFNELIYAGKEVERLCKDKYLQAEIEDASDIVHDERFEIENIRCKDFYLFAFEQGFLLNCFTFLLAIMDETHSVNDINPEISEAIQAIKSKIREIEKTKG